MAIKFIKFKDIESKIQDKGVQIVNFYADWCGPCKMFAPILEEISSEYEVYKINIDENKDEIKDGEIQGIPFTRIYKKGQIIEKISGYVSKEKLIEATKK